MTFNLGPPPNGPDVSLATPRRGGGGVTADRRLVVNKGTGCWEWLGTVSDQGYGQISIGRRRLYVHRLMWELFNGPVPPDKEIDHLCRVRHCANPDHLEPVTQYENWLRGESPFVKRFRQTHCKRGHEFTPENTYISRGRRHCRACAAAREKHRPRRTRGGAS